MKHYDSYCSRTVSCVLECNCNSNGFKSFPPNNHGPTNRYLQHLLGLLISETLKTKRYCAPGNKAFSGNLSRVKYNKQPVRRCAMNCCYDCLFLEIKGARGPQGGYPLLGTKIYIYIYPPFKGTFENDVPFLELGYHGIC